MTLKEIKELNDRFKKNEEDMSKFYGNELLSKDGKHIGVDLMLNDEGLELQICKVNEINDTKNGKEKIWETFAFEEINIDKFETDEELDKYLEYVVDFYENRVKNDIDEEGFVINRDLARNIDYMEYKGIQVHYIYDTNTLLFSYANKETLNDSDDLDTIVYRNYTKEDIEKHIDTELKKCIVENQQEKLVLGILKLMETHRTLKELNFSDCVLNEIKGILDDLKGLVEDENMEKIVKESEKYDK